MKLCDYGCGQTGKYQFKNGKVCCSKSHNSCKKIRKDRSNKLKGKFIGIDSSMFGKVPWNKGGTHSQETKKILRKKRTGKNNPMYGKNAWNKGKKGVYSKETLDKMKKAQLDRNHSVETKLKISETKKFSSIDYKKRYPWIFPIIEKIRDKNKNVEVKCKNCNDWFVPTSTQLFERIRQINYGNGGCYFYCSDKCKNICSIYNQKIYPKGYIISKNKVYTQEEYETFREFVLERDDYECQYCGNKAKFVHHERPQKLEPFFSLDPDFAWSCCEECHYKYGHKTESECSTGNLANIVCLGD
jgi:hypothetical protein